MNRRMALRLGLATGGLGLAAPATARGTGDALMDWVSSPRPAVSRPLPARPPETPPTGGAGEQAQTWTLTLEDRTLYHGLTRWSALAGWQFVWDAERDFPIESQVQLSGSFLQALSAVLGTLKDSDYPLQALANPRSQTVRIVRQLDPPRR